MTYIRGLTELHPTYTAGVIAICACPCYLPVSGTQVLNCMLHRSIPFGSCLLWLNSVHSGRNCLTPRRRQTLVPQLVFRSTHFALPKRAAHSPIQRKKQNMSNMLGISTLYKQTKILQYTLYTSINLVYALLQIKHLMCKSRLNICLYVRPIKRIAIRDTTDVNE